MTYLFGITHRTSELIATFDNERDAINFFEGCTEQTLRFGFVRAFKNGSLLSPYIGCYWITADLPHNPLSPDQRFNMDFCISKEQLEKALEQLEVARENGFKDSLVVLKVYTEGETDSNFLSRYDSVILKAHPTNPNFNWGRMWDLDWQRFENGRFVNAKTGKSV